MDFNIDKSFLSVFKKQPKGNEVTTKWMVAKRWSSISSGNKVICVCPSTEQLAFHFGKNSSSVTKKNLLERGHP